ncbi:uncharacterized protein [Amphiura filiformis]|uniref:uncharacterized protein n=1 Tax=Amphiura filiformis TaxID=82378 RepID=UPI003B21807A
MMSDLQFLQSTVRGILLPNLTNEVVTQSTTQAISPSTSSPASTMMGTMSLTKEQTALIAIGAIGVIGIPFMCGTCLDEYLRRNRYFRCLRWLQRLKILEYKRESIKVPNSKLCNPSNSHTNSVVTLTPNLDNFPDPPSVKVSYLIKNHHNLGPYDASSSHALLVHTHESTRVKAYAMDPYGYIAECYFDIFGDPLIEPITNHTRTSTSTATVRQVECKNFPTGSQVYVAYYDGEECLGKFPLGEEHKLTKLKETTWEIIVRATDGFGHKAETRFIADQHSPMCISVFYRRFSRPTYKSVAVKELQIDNSVNNNSTKPTTLCDDDKPKDRLKHETSSGSTSYSKIL